MGNASKDCKVLLKDANTDFLYETPTEALSMGEFQISLWPGAIPCSGHAGYKKIIFRK